MARAFIWFVEEHSPNPADLHVSILALASNSHHALGVRLATETLKAHTYLRGAGHVLRLLEGTCTRLSIDWKGFKSQVLSMLALSEVLNIN